MLVLVVEDDPAVAVPLLEGLRRNGFDTEHVAYASQVVPAATSKSRIDVILLDLGLPEGDGLEVLRELRRTSDIPVIIVTARGGEGDRVVGLELGADDYVVKPFSVRELTALVSAVARRRRVESTSEGGRVVVDRTRHIASVDGMAIELAAKEFDLLAVLAEEQGAPSPARNSSRGSGIWCGSARARR